MTLINSDGAILCGVFIAVHNAIQQMQMDDGVDIFTAVRQLQVRRPELCATFVSFTPIFDSCQFIKSFVGFNIVYKFLLRKIKTRTKCDVTISTMSMEFFFYLL